MDRDLVKVVVVTVLEVVTTAVAVVLVEDSMAMKSGQAAGQRNGADDIASTDTGLGLTVDHPELDGQAMEDARFLGGTGHCVASYNNSSVSKEKTNKSQLFFAHFSTTCPGVVVTNRFFFYSNNV